MVSKLDGKIAPNVKGIGPAIPVVKPLEPPREVAKPKAVQDRAAWNPHTATQAANTAQKRTDDLLNYGVADDKVGKVAAGQTAKDPSKTVGKTSPPKFNRFESGIVAILDVGGYAYIGCRESGRRQGAALRGQPAPPQLEWGAENEVLPLLPGEVRRPGSKPEEPTVKEPTKKIRSYAHPLLDEPTAKVPSKAVGKPAPPKFNRFESGIVAALDVAGYAYIGCRESGRRQGAALRGQPAPPQLEWGAENEVLPLLPGEVRRPIPKK